LNIKRAKFITRTMAIHAEARGLLSHIEQTPLAFIEWDMNFCVRSWNLSAKKMFSYSSDEAMGKHARFFLPKEDWEAIDQVWDELINQDGGSRSTNHNVTKNGEIILCEWYNTTLRDNNNEVIGVASLALDITENENAAKEIHSARELYKNLFNQIADPVVIFDQETHKFLDCNQSTLNQYEFSKSEFLELTPHDLHPPENLSEVAKNIDDKDSIKPNEYIHISKLGRTFPVEVHTQDVLYRNRKAYISIIRDNTERKKFELELNIAKDKAEQSDRLKSAFLANMSHEIRTPMNAILGFSELLKDIESLDNGEAKQAIEIINGSGERLMTLINDLIDISKIEAGEIRISQNPINPGLITEKIAQQFSNEAKQKNIQLLHKECKSNPELVILSDENRIMQVLSNLIKNALKFSSHGTITVAAKYKKKHIKFYVKDSGEGISDVDQKKIFDRFIQLENPEDSGTEGAGLGLSICKALVEKMGGKIGVISEIGKGSKFFFTIPL